jgi:hypothetical protein
MIIRAFIDNFSSALTHARFNYKYLLVATVGLIMSLSIISSASIFVDSQRSIIIGQVIEDNYANHWYLSYNSPVGYNNNELEVVINKTFDEFGFLDKIENIEVSSYINEDFILTDNSSYARNPWEWYEINRILNWNSYDLSLFELYAEKPFNLTNSEEIILLNFYQDHQDYCCDDDEENRELLELNKEYEFIARWEVLRKNITLTNIINISYSEFENLAIQNPSYWDFWGNSLFVNDFVKFLDQYSFQVGIYHYMHQVDPENNEMESSYFTFTDLWGGLIFMEIFYEIEFDLTNFDFFDISSTVNKFNELDSTIRNHLYDLGFINENSHVWSYNDFSGILEEMVDLSTFLFASIMLFSFPIIIVGIFLAYYSFGLIKHNALRKLNVYLTRGISRFQYFSYLIFEMILSLIFAIFLAIALSIPITSVVLRSSNFLEFNQLISPVLIIFHLIELLTQFGVLLALLTNIFRIIQMSRTEISQIEEIIVEERNVPFWRRKNIDIVILGFGILFFTLATIINEFNSGFGMEIQPGFGPDSEIIPQEFYLIISLPVPLLIILGSVMLTSRIFSPITERIGTFLWKSYGTLTAFSLRNVVKHRHSSTNALILISLTLSFALSFLIFPFSFIAFEETKIHYDLGADIVVHLNTEEVSESEINYLLSNFSDQIESYSPVSRIELENQHMMVIDTDTFSRTAWMRDDFVPNFEEKMEILGSENYTLLLYEENLALSGQSIGSKFLWNNPYNYWVDILRNKTEHEFKIIGNFHYWPRLLYEEPYDPQVEFFGVISYKTYNNIREELGNELNYALNTDQVKLYIKPMANMNQTFFRESLEEFEEVWWVDTYEDNLKLFRDAPQFLTTIGQINSYLIYSILIIIIILLMFGFKLIVERGKEIATERAVGMTLTQNFFVFLVETLWLIMFSVIIGFIFGTIFSSLFLLGYTQGPSFPSFTMVFPWALIFLLITVLIILGILLSFIPAYLSSQLEVNKLLKVE